MDYRKYQEIDSLGDGRRIVAVDSINGVKERKRQKGFGDGDKVEGGGGG